MSVEKYIQISYANRLGLQLENFKQKRADQWTFSHSCEAKHGLQRKKSRGYIYEYKGALVFKCHHCGASNSLFGFIKEENPALYDEYRIEAYRAEHTPLQVQAPVEAAPVIDANLDGLIPVTSLPPSSAILKFLERRKIPNTKYNLLHVAKNFYPWATQYKPEFRVVDDSSPRLVLPYFDMHGRVFGFTARTFSPTVEPRYIHLRLDKNVDFIYGTERINPRKTIYITEGQIDSLFLENAVAVGGANYGSAFVQSVKSNCVIVPDNDWRRNSQVAGQLKKAINDGYKVCLFPATIKEKDLNDLAKGGMSLPEIKNVVDSHTYVGLTAQLEFALLKKCK